MSSLASRLQRISDGFADSLPEEALALMQRAARELEESGVHRGAVGEGDEAPGFSLPNADGTTVSLAELRDAGPVVVTFFRGHW